MKTEKFTVVLHDELPVIGSGRRVVLAQVGLRWVRVQNLSTGAVFAKCPLSIWNDIVACDKTKAHGEAKPADIKKADAARVIRAHEEGATKAKKKAARSGPSKADQVADMLRRPEGATIAQIAKAMGWLPHTTRAFISVNIKRKLGLTVSREVVDKVSVYRVVDEDEIDSKIARKRLADIQADPKRLVKGKELEDRLAAT